MPYDGAVGGFRLRWDVFLSFRGEDTRQTITNSLYDALVRRGVRVFRDDDASTAATRSRRVFWKRSTTRRPPSLCSRRGTPTPGGALRSSRRSATAAGD
ncbi:hypothetical protein ACLB2K_033528 [Fragaria x ananassa]